jgi:hypothetical protein
MHVLLTTSHRHIDHDIVLVDARMGSGLYTSSCPEGAAFRPAHGSSTTPILQFILMMTSDFGSSN